METETKSNNLVKIILSAIGVLLLMGLAGGGYYYMDKKLKDQKAADKKTIDEANKKIEELNKKVEQIDTQSSGTVNSNTTTASVLKLSDLGIKFNVDSRISDLTYSVSSLESASFSTKSLVTEGGQSCSAANGPLGYITVTTQAPAKPADGNYSPNISEAAFVKKVGDKYIYYVHAQGVCSTIPNQKAENLQTDGSNYLRQSLLSAEQI
jgi:hypothetical protein